MTVPARWRLAGWVRTLPEFRGRDRLFLLARGSAPAPQETICGAFGNALRFEADLSVDGSLEDLFFLQYEPPSLAPVFDVVLRPGDGYIDVGANIGVYAGWAARCVGPEGIVHAFEPVPATRALLERFVELNRLKNVRIIPRALGAAGGEIELRLVQGASGLASAVGREGGETIRVGVTTLDDHVRETGGAPLRLVKIDVEGYEFEVLRGAAGLLSGRLVQPPPAVVFETQEEMLQRAGTTFGELVAWLEETAGYATYALTSSGLLRYPGGNARPVTTNALAVHPAHHAELFRALEHRKFRRNQTC